MTETRSSWALLVAVAMAALVAGPSSPASAEAQGPFSEALRSFFSNLSAGETTTTRDRDARDRQIVRARTVSRSGRSFNQKYRRKVVRYQTRHKPGTIVIDSRAKFLYLVEGNGKARRYGIGVGRQGFGWRGTVKVGRKAKWPTWTPPAAMIRREPYLRRYASGMPGGVNNPLGARALYLYRGGRDTLYRIHGTNEPWTIGMNVSSGCIRLRNEDIVDLYGRARVGAKVVVL